MWQTTKIFSSFHKHKGLVGVIPALLFVLFFFIGGFLHSVSISLGNYPEIYGEHEFAWTYKALFNESFLQSLGVTVGMATVVALFSGLIGLVIALLLASFTFNRTWAHLIFQLPFGVPHLLAAYMLTQVFMQTGWYSRITYHLGWIDSFEAFPVVIHDQWGMGVLLAYLWKEIPFIVLLLYPFITKLLTEWEETSRMLGASVIQMVRWVILPILLPIWVGGMWVVFSFVLGAYEIPALMARTSFGFIPIMAWQEYTQFGLERQPLAIAMNVVLAFVAFCIGLILLFFQKKWYASGRRIWGK
ncbi:ABC transporter permease subunit [Bacillus sp. B15-48]|uniref:ABC transporter permease n=1 Tax=Bacillus sp. B15-48 TaxID=1548601 RepID=UPI00193F52D2|nr:ABC transporter permease subunit [Bacillus sp. B15-48]MBM4762965.1 ABC transporter permease subunit [Bacillus sp. B15-48]